MSGLVGTLICGGSGVLPRATPEGRGTLRAKPCHIPRQSRLPRAEGLCFRQSTDSDAASESSFLQCSRMR